MHVTNEPTNGRMVNIQMNKKKSSNSHTSKFNYIERRFLHCHLPLLISREQCIVHQTIHQQFATIDLDEHSLLLLLLYACVYVYEIQFQKGERSNNGDFSATNDALLFARFVRVCECKLNFSNLLLKPSTRPIFSFVISSG